MRKCKIMNLNTCTSKNIIDFHINFHKSINFILPPWYSQYFINFCNFREFPIPGKENFVPESSSLFMRSWWYAFCYISGLNFNGNFVLHLFLFTHLDFAGHFVLQFWKKIEAFMNSYITIAIIVQNWKTRLCTYFNEQLKFLCLILKKIEDLMLNFFLHSILFHIFILCFNSWKMRCFVEFLHNNYSWLQSSLLWWFSTILIFSSSFSRKMTHCIQPFRKPSE